MDHFRAHHNPKFEGYYSRFHLPSGASLLVILCDVPDAPDGRPGNLTVTYVPPDGAQIWQAELWPPKMQVQDRDDGSFELSTSCEPHDKSARGTTNDQISIRHALRGSSMRMHWGSHDNNTLSIEADVHSHTPWEPSESLRTSSPEGWFINLPLPLHWHVLSGFSPCTLNLSLPAEANQHPDDKKKNMPCIVHFEKNWAHSFPPAHNWVQGVRIPDTSTASAIYEPGQSPGQAYNQAKPHLITLAGGLILGIEAYLCGYRNSEAGISVEFRPPFTMNLQPLLFFLPLTWQSFLQPLLSPFTYVKRDWHNRSLNFSFSDLFWRLDVSASAPADRFYDFAAPTPGGFREKWMAQSLSGEAFVKVWKRTWTLGWRLVCEDWFENVGVEFGGDYYPGRGKGQKGVIKWDGQGSTRT